jgi:hypothetical protein
MNLDKKCQNPQNPTHKAQNKYNTCTGSINGQITPFTKPKILNITQFKQNQWYKTILVKHNFQKQNPVFMQQTHVARMWCGEHWDNNTLKHPICVMVKNSQYMYIYTQF